MKVFEIRSTALTTQELTRVSELSCLSDTVRSLLPPSAHTLNNSTNTRTADQTLRNKNKKTAF